MTPQTPFTLIIPAHKEERVIARCLKTVLADAPDDHPMQVIVAANGCDDNTVAEAQAAAPSALVLDLPKGSKTLAMNAANALAEHFPRIYLDADVQCDYNSLAALARALVRPGIMAASPTLALDLSRSNFLVRAYYRVWMSQPYVTDDMVGSGCFGLSEAGYRRIGDFPEITGDDVWVYSRFKPGERRNIAKDEDGRPVRFVVSPPRTARDQIRVETRRKLGNEQVRKLYPTPHYSGANSLGNLRLALSAGASVSDIAIYLAMKGLSRFRAARRKSGDGAIVWERDIAARET